MDEPVPALRIVASGDESQAADAEADVLAILAAVLAGDLDGMTAVARGAFLPALFTTMMNLAFEVLAEHGIDPAAWVATRQAALLARLANDDRRTT